MEQPILVVEDEPSVRDVIAEILEDAGYAVVAARDGEEALRAAQQAPPSLVLLDLLLPQIDGFALARRLKAHPSTRYVPIIAISALGSPNDRGDALRSGCDAFIAKPFDLADLLAMVRRYIGDPPARS